jgi:hypothetical protein
MYVSAQGLDFLDLAKNCSFPNQKRAGIHPVSSGRSGHGKRHGKRLSLHMGCSINVVAAERPFLMLSQ